jgi:hypothetical protein
MPLCDEPHPLRAWGVGLHARPLHPGTAHSFPVTLGHALVAPRPVVVVPVQEAMLLEIWILLFQDMSLVHENKKIEETKMNYSKRK